MLQVYLNAPGQAPIKHCRTIDPAALGVTEQQTIEILNTLTAGWTELGRRVKSQLVIVRDGVIVAVDAFSTGKLVWVDQAA